MKLGADPKRVAALAVLVLIAGYVLYTNVFSGSGSTSASSPRAVAAPAPIANPAQTTTTFSSNPVAGRRRDQSRNIEFKPVLDRDKSLDPMRVDPTLRLDLLAKVQGVELGGAQRNLFQFAEAPKPDTQPLPKVPQIKGLGGQQGAIASGPPKPVTPAVPQPPPIQLKYYGYSSAKNDGRKHAFFLDGDDIIVASEGETLKKRYKLVKIGVNSVTMEDTEFNSQQTLPLAPEAAG